MPDPEQIPDEADVSRLLFSFMKGDASDLVADRTFQFPKDDGFHESLVWRKYRAQIAEVHQLGCEQQKASEVEQKTTKKYIGAASTTAGRIRQIRSVNGHGFSIEHAPEPEWHVKIAYDPLRKPGPNDKQHLLGQLLGAFDLREWHTCE